MVFRMILPSGFDLGALKGHLNVFLTEINFCYHFSRCKLPFRQSYFRSIFKTEHKKKVLMVPDAKLLPNVFFEAPKPKRRKKNYRFAQYAILSCRKLRLMMSFRLILSEGSI